MSNITLDNGKYEVIRQDAPWKFEALRHGEPWRDLTGDNLVYHLCAHFDELTAEVASYQEQLRNEYDKREALEQERDELVIKNKRQEDIICVLMNADETGYVDGEGFVIGFNQITDEAKAMLDKRDLESGAKHIYNTLLSVNPSGEAQEYILREVMKYANQLTKQAED